MKPTYSRMGSASENVKLSPLSLLSVRIIKANVTSCTDSSSASGSYVTLYLPSASYKKFRTQTVTHSNKPVWNETFYFRIQTEIKNILELEVCDANIGSRDDVELIVHFDLVKLQPGTIDRELFSLKPKKENGMHNYDSLEVEFTLLKIPESSEKLTSNGVVVARELSILDVQVNKEVNENLLKVKKSVVLTVQESYEGTQKTAKDLDYFCFHCIKSWEPVLKAKLQDISSISDDSEYSLILPLKLVPVGQRVRVDLPVGEGETLELLLRVSDWEQDLDVRLGYELCAEEQNFLNLRKRRVSHALSKMLNLGRELPEHQVPVIGVMATGGGFRAMSALYGHLLALQKLNVLDCVSYITTASGSTWTLTDLYRDPHWSHKSLEKSIAEVKKQMLKSKWDIISMDRLKYYHKELVERQEKGHLSSFTALWALVQDAFLHNHPNQTKLTEQRQALKSGQNPLPLYTAINVRDKISTLDFREWVEFSPYEVGFQKYGASIDSENFDSEFFMGKLVKKIPESRICFLEGIWTNVFCRNLLDGLYWSSTPDEFWERWIKDMSNSEKENAEDGFSTVYKPPSGGRKLCQIFNDILRDRPLKGESYNFLQEFVFDKDFLQQKEYIKWKDTILDACPNELTPSKKSLCLIDIGYFINNSGSPLIKPERNVDVIISLSYDMSSVFKQAQMMAKYCEVQGIPFPKIEPSEEDMKNPKECYIFEDEDDPRVPIVLYFPLVNCSFKEYKEPGVKRTPSEMRGGEVNVCHKDSPYRTMHVTYSGEDFDKLINLSVYNILTSKDYIIQAIQRAIQRKQKVFA